MFYFKIFRLFRWGYFCKLKFFLNIFITYVDGHYDAHVILLVTRAWNALNNVNLEPLMYTEKKKRLWLFESVFNIVRDEKCSLKIDADIFLSIKWSHKYPFGDSRIDTCEHFFAWSHWTMINELSDPRALRRGFK